MIYSYNGKSSFVKWKAESMWNDHWSIMKPAYFIIWFSFNINFRFSIKWSYHKYVKYTCSMETVQQNGRFTLFSSKFHSNIYSILFIPYPLDPSPEVYMTIWVLVQSKNSFINYLLKLFVLITEIKCYKRIFLEFCYTLEVNIL